RQMTGDCEFNEVFLDDVAVPVDHLIGTENDGWRVASTTLANERGASFIWKEQVLHEAAIDRLWKTCSGAGLLDNPLVRQRLARSWMDVEIFRLHNRRTLARLARGDEIGSEPSLVTLFWANISQRLYETPCDVLGPAALLDPPQHGPRRRVATGRFTPRARRPLQDETERIALEILEDTGAPGTSGVVDCVERIAAPFPLAVIAWTLGVPLADVGLLFQW